MALPDIQLVDIRQETPPHGLSARLLRAIEERLANDEQVLIFINRRGYAPVLRCGSCGWLSNCSRCSAYPVLHKGLRPYLPCHHCGEQWPVGRASRGVGDQV